MLGNKDQQQQNALRGPGRLTKTGHSASLRRLFAPKGQWCAAARGFERNWDVTANTSARW